MSPSLGDRLSALCTMLVLGPAAHWLRWSFWYYHPQFAARSTLMLIRTIIVSGLRLLLLWISVTRSRLSLLPLNYYCSWFLSSPRVSHQTPFRQILVPATEPFVGLYGPDPGSEELFSPANFAATCSFGNSPRSADWGLTRGSRGGCWNHVSAHLGCLDVVWRVRTPFCNFALHCIRADPEYLLLSISVQSIDLIYWMKYCSLDLLRRVFKQTFNRFGQFAYLEYT